MLWKGKAYLSITQYLLQCYFKSVTHVEKLSGFGNDSAFLLCVNKAYSFSWDVMRTSIDHPWETPSVCLFWCGASVVSLSEMYT